MKDLANLRRGRDSLYKESDISALQIQGMACEIRMMGTMSVVEDGRTERTRKQ